MGDYQAPLFLAWQLTNRCRARCLHCCEESGPDRGWKDELTRPEALAVARQIAGLRIPDCAFGGGEPLEAPHVWDIFEVLHRGGVSLKIETNGLLIDRAAARRLQGLGADSIQISLDGATAEVHERVRPGGDFRGALRAVELLAAEGLEPEVVFVPNRLNRADAVKVLDLAARAGARRFVTGPMMRLGRAAAAWGELGLAPEEWGRCRAELAARASAVPGVQLSAYPWDILEEIRARRERPQAMLLVVPDGKVKLLNALPFVCADLRKVSLAEAWRAYLAAWSHPDVLDFTERAQRDPSLLRHANETWTLAPAPISAGSATRARRATARAPAAP